MAGVVAMASVIEDFDTQPCKKARKDGGSPVVKTITNYFSPVAKPVEKPFSPPRSNNIMDYFSRKAPLSKEKISPPEPSKENCQTTQSAEKHITPEEAVKRPSQKRGRKASKAARKLMEAETVSITKDCLTETHESKDSAAEATSSSGVLSNDTAAPLNKFNAEAFVTEGISEKSVKKEKYEDVSKCGESVTIKPELNNVSLSPVVSLSSKAKQVKTAARNCRKRQQQEAKQPEEDKKEPENSLCDVSMEVNVDEASLLNSSTVTISFEDFLRSQSQDKGEEDTEDGCKITTDIQKMDKDQMDIHKAEENMDSGEPSPRVSPRTLTIQAEVHAVSAKEQPLQVEGKFASIFNKRKGSNVPVEMISSPHTEAGPQRPSTSLTVKRRSNVVLQEEDLELAVLESESTPRSSEAERKQFMAAFKQPSLDGSKTKSGKSQVKQKQPDEKKLDTADKVAEEDTVIPPAVEQVPAASQESSTAKKKPARKRRKKDKVEKETVTTSPAVAVDEIVDKTVDDDDKREEPPNTATPSVSALRRSRREAVVRKASEAMPITPIRKTRKQIELKDADAVTTALPDSPIKVSTPKTCKTKHGVFIAEIVCSPNTKESPIRIKFTRVHRSVSMSKAESGAGLNSSLATKTSDVSKKRKQAKKLVNKAKVIQQSKRTRAEEKGTLRRSSRNQASIKKSYCEDEDSVIWVGENQITTPKLTPKMSKSQKALRSLNDVLGKAIPAGKETKPVPGSKVALLGQEKTSRKVSIFDESSRDGSENSQDDEQFRARREFLKSGLPESLRKRIAKTAATKEAYSLSCSSFNPVIHMKQPPNDCPLWSLPWPESPLLSHLKELWSQTSTRLLSVSGSFCLKTEPAQRVICDRSSRWRPNFSESVRQLLLEEVRTSNPPFPVMMFISRFLKRRSDYQNHCIVSEQEPSRVTCTPLPAEPAGGKRKRIGDDGKENTMKVAKKQRTNHSQGNTSTPEPEPTQMGGRTRRAQRARLEEEEKVKASPSNKTTPIPSADDSVVILDDLILVEDSGRKVCSTDVMKEDVLWTEKYQPQHSNDIIGNTTSVRRLHSWLREWKLRADREERKKQKDKKLEEGSNDSDWDCGEEDSQDGEDMLCNTVLITGPTGVGKTAAVYACAQELGFKVFEVNASSQRSGRLILSQLKEATQSHQVDSQGVNAHKPTYFNSYGTSSSAGTVRPGSSPRKVNSPRRVASSPRKHPQSPRGAKRGGLAPTSLANFFKMGRPTNKQPPKTDEQMAASKKVMNANTESANLPKDFTGKAPSTSTPSEELSKKMATSLILFEEVDVIFDDDSGFLAAIKTFMTTTKRPVILTTSDPAFSSMFDGNFEEIHFKMPSVLNVGSYLQLLCLAEDMRTDLSDISSLLRINGCDIRQSLLQLQFWTHSAGGCHITRPATSTGSNIELKLETGEAEGAPVCAVTVPNTLPPCVTGCAQTRLGLFSIEPDRDIWELLRSPSLVEEAVCWELLTDSRRRGVDLLYSNMETLLPLPLTELTISTHKSQQFGSVLQEHPSVTQKEPPLSSCLQSETAELADCSDDDSPLKVSNQMRKNKRRLDLPDQYTDSDSENSFLTLCKPLAAPPAEEKVRESVVSDKVKRKPLTPEERVKSLPVSQCLESIADFLDNMSYMDSLLLQPERGDFHRATSPVGAVVKYGMTDEARVETDNWSWVRSERVLEIQAAVEALGFHKCQMSVAEAWDKAQKLEGDLGREAEAELTLPVAPHCKGYSFTQDMPCQPLLVQRRREVMESLMLGGLPGTLGNRAAAALDYLPALRTICRSEQLKEQGKVKRRFLHYLDAVHLGLEKSTIQHLAEDFP
ncbi:ATPase family AAA domain-containing protein 5 [Mastacembelus armatus]|uniref:ATPase family AAA domain-containing protein 5 n=1 Tax=Mastacembelus armatus TaxID=205130 RepID=UPI000E455F81|nr:ATPase family AAA domain-containing protein 5-like [Mastacembelus armatus]